MNKSNKSQGVSRSIIALVAVFSLIFVGSAYAASTIGTNITTTGKMHVGGSAAQTVFEVQGTASASYFLTGNTIQVGGFASAAYNRFGTSTTGHSNYISTTNDVLVSGDLEVRATASFGSVASVSGVLYLAGGQVRPGLNDSTTAFRFQNAAGTTSVLVIDTTNTRVGIGKTPATTFDVSGSASVSLNFEATGYASASQGFFTTDIIVGHNVASSSSTYVAEFGGGAGTATVSLLFGSSDASSKGTCLQMKNTIGTWVYARVVGTTWTVNTIPCHL